MRIPRLLLSVGAMKSGTSWLFNQLGRHPLIETTPVKEIHYFAHQHTSAKYLTDEARLSRLKTYSENVEICRSFSDIQHDLAFFTQYMNPKIDDTWFKRLFQSGRSVYKAEFSNINAVLPDEGYKNIRSVASTVRVIYVLRDPIARLWSHAKFHAAVGGMLDRFEEFNKDELKTYLLDPVLFSHSRYADNIRHMRQHFSEREFRVFFFEQLITDEGRKIQEIYDFLGIHSHPVDNDLLSEVFNAGPELGMSSDFQIVASELLAPEYEAIELRTSRAQSERHRGFRRF